MAVYGSGPCSAAVSRRAFVAGAAGVAGAALAVGLVGCSGGDENVSAEPISPSEGKLGGKLTLYTSCSESLINAVVPAFMSEHGVAVSVVRASTASCLARVEAEVAAGTPVADVVWGGDESWYAAPAAVPCFETYVSGENHAVRDDCRNIGGTVTPVTREVPVVVSAEDGAADAGSVAGEAGVAGVAGAAVGVAVEDAAESGALAAYLAAALPVPVVSDAANDAFWTQAKTLQEAAVTVAGDETGDGEAALSAVLFGEAASGLGFEQSCVVAAREQGGLRVSYPGDAEKPVAVLGCTAVVKGCANLEQAHAWIDYVTGQACQGVLVGEARARPVRDDAGSPEGLPELGDVRAVEREALLATWSSVADGSWVPTGEAATEGAEEPAA